MRSPTPAYKFPFNVINLLCLTMAMIMGHTMSQLHAALAVMLVSSMAPVVLTCDVWVYRGFMHALGLQPDLQAAPERYERYRYGSNSSSSVLARLFIAMFCLLVVKPADCSSTTDLCFLCLGCIASACLHV